MNVFDANIIEKEKISTDTMLMKFRCEEKFQAEPGQFLNLQVEPPQESRLFLRRPFAIHYIYDDRRTFKILFRIKGNGTRMLAGKQVGDRINFIGPCGRGFQYSRLRGGRVAIIAGGIGIAPFPLLIKHLAASGIKTDLYYGEFSKEYLVQYYHWEHKLLRTFVSTDDGKVGFKGTVIDMFRFNLDKFDIRYKAIYACGPFPMLYELAHNPPSPCRLS